MKRVNAFAPGKCILFGEHAVVYGHPAIAMAISKTSKCTIERINVNKIKINLRNYSKRIEFPNYNDLINNFPEDIHSITYCLMSLTDNYDLDVEDINITISSDLIPSSGLGSSASTSVALVGALSGFYELNLKKEEISKIAYEMEKIVHGSPSGIDNTACTFGNLIYFKDGNVDILNVPKNMNFLITHTNIKHNTGQAVENVGNLYEEKPKMVKTIFKNIAKATEFARIELKNENADKVGVLMNKNQDFLSKIGVSNEIIDDIVNIALNNGALGSKLTGAGLGGCVLSLGTEEDLLEISKLLEIEGYSSFLANIDQEGVRIEGTW